MINVDSRLIQEDLKKMGVDAFAVIMVITSHINAKRTAWPGIDRIRKMTGLSKARTYDAIKTLIELEHIERSQINKKGSFGKVIYRVTTKYLSIFMGADQFELEEEPLAGITEYGNTEYGNAESAKPESGNPAYISISQDEVLTNLSINQKEVLTDFKKSAVHPSKTEDNFEPVFKKTGFKKPEMPELISFFQVKMKEKNFSGWQDGGVLEAEKFFNYYESIGWCVGKKKMVSWNHAVGGWIARIKNNTNAKDWKNSPRKPVADNDQRIREIEQARSRGEQVFVIGGPGFE